MARSVLNFPYWGEKNRTAFTPVLQFQGALHSQGQRFSTVLDGDTYTLRLSPPILKGEKILSSKCAIFLIFFYRDRPLVISCEKALRPTRDPLVGNLSSTTRTTVLHCPMRTTSSFVQIPRFPPPPPSIFLLTHAKDEETDKLVSDVVLELILLNSRRFF